MIHKKILIVFSVMLATASGCTKSPIDNSVGPCDSNISYSSTVRQLFSTNCNTSGCHDDIVITSLSTYQTVHDGAQQIKNAIIAGRMPKNMTLPVTDKNTIICWIDNGSKNN